MVKSWFLVLLIITLFISDSLSKEYGRTATMGSSDIVRSPSEFENALSARREMVVTTMDYMDPGPNTDPRATLPNTPPSPSSP